MCQTPRRILKRRSVAASKRADKIQIITVCEHGIEVHYCCDKDLGRGWTYAPRNRQTLTHHFVLWPEWIREFAKKIFAPKKQKNQLSVVQARAKTANEKLAEWEKKLKLAKTKIAKWRKKVKYYKKKLPVAEFDHLLSLVPEIK